MEVYVGILIFVLVVVILVAFIIDRIDKKKRMGKIDNNTISDGEKDFVEKKREIMDEFQRLSTQVISFR